MRSLSLDESRRRADLLTVTSYDVSLDLAGDDRTFGSTATIRFTSRGTCGTFVEVQPVRLLDAWLNGAQLDVGLLENGRLPLTVADGDNELVVEAVMGYRHDGEGMHRAVDPADGRHYTYAMSATDAAPSIFACFDQPDLKAPYTFHVSTPTDWVVVGNGRAEEVEPGSWELATTQPLSTYFVTLVAGPYHVVRSEHDGITLGLECRVSLAEHLDQDAEEIFTITSQCFDEFHRLFGVRYPFGDYHQAFVPEFNMGAMENPGCVTFRDSLVFTSKVTRAERTNRATTIAHEMAHMWFGDLVTMKWFDDLWLNESFAEYMGQRVTYDATAFTDAWIDNAFGRKYWGLTADQRASTHPVAATGVLHAEEALQNLDGITYAKGAAVVKQLNASLGDKVFFAGVREHFTRHRFANATMQDLFLAWQSAGASDLGEWSQSWLRTPGLDLIQLDRSGAIPVVARTTPDEHPADRQHAMSLAWHEDGQGWSSEPVTLGPGPVAVPTDAAGRSVVLDPADQTWARFTIDQLTLDALPSLLPTMSDPLMRATVWNAVRDGVRNALLEPLLALALVEAGLPHEDKDSGVAALGRFAIDTLCGRLLKDPGSGLERVFAAAAARTRTAEPESGVQLAAMRAAIASCADPSQLREWLAGMELPAGVSVDLDLRWKILLRLATLGAVERSELHEWLERDTTTQAQVDLTQCLASLPDQEAKTHAWDMFRGAADATNHELEAAGVGFWHRGQEHLTNAYVDRYFTEVSATAKVRSGYVLAEAAQVFFPRKSLERSTLEAAGTALADDSLDHSLRRAIEDETDDLAKGLLARETFQA